MPPFKVIIGGHSQCPAVENVPRNCEIQLCKVRGGKLSDFWSHSLFRCMRNEPHDLAILFLGGNDIHDGCSPNHIVGEILRIADHLKVINRKVVITLIEPRKYEPGNRFGVSPETYDKVARSINRKLSKPLQRKSIRTINLGAEPFMRGHVSEGVHFNYLTAQHLSLKFVKCIEHHMTA